MNLKNYKVNVSIDDVSPHPKSSIKVLDRCYELIEEFKDIKFTLFVPMAYWRTIDHKGLGTNTNECLDIQKYPEFCNFLAKLPEENFELGYHGYYHGIPRVSNNDEFQKLNYLDAIKKFSIMYETVNKTCLAKKIKPIFRPPAWRMSQEAIKAALDCGIEILALSPKDYAQQTYGDLPPCDIVYYNVNPPFDELKLFDKTDGIEQKIK